MDLTRIFGVRILCAQEFGKTLFVLLMGFTFQLGQDKTRFDWESFRWSVGHNLGCRKGNIKEITHAFREHNNEACSLLRLLPVHESPLSMLKKQVEDPLLQLRNMVKQENCLKNDRGVIKRLRRMPNLTPVSNVCDWAALRFLFWAPTRIRRIVGNTFRISFQTDWQIDNAFF